MLRDLCHLYERLFIEYVIEWLREKYRIRETSNLSTHADSSTDTTVGWTENTQKPKKIKKKNGKKSKTEKLKNV